MERVLVTGMTGKSGSYLLEELKKAPIEDMTISALVRSASAAERIIASGLPIDIREGDLGDYESVRAAMTGIDTVLHIAGIQKSLNIARAAKECGVKRLILVHTTGIYSKYKAAGALYIEIEEQISEMLKGTDISVTILRPTMIYGSLDDKNMIRFIRMVDRFRVFPVVRGGRFALQPVHATDLGRAYYQVLLCRAETENRNFDLSGGTVIDLIDILKCIAEYLGKKRTFVSVPFWFAYSGAWGLYLVTLGRVDYREKVQRLVEPRAYPHDEATAAFGYAPIDFKDGLRAEVNEYLESQGRNPADNV